MEVNYRRILVRLFEIVDDICIVILIINYYFFSFLSITFSRNNCLDYYIQDQFLNLNRIKFSKKISKQLNIRWKIKKFSCKIIFHIEEIFFFIFLEISVFNLRKSRKNVSQKSISQPWLQIKTVVSHFENLSLNFSTIHLRYSFVLLLRETRMEFCDW